MLLYPFVRNWFLSLPSLLIWILQENVKSLRWQTICKAKQPLSKILTLSTGLMYLLRKFIPFLITKTHKFHVFLHAFSQPKTLDTIWHLKDIKIQNHMKLKCKLYYNVYKIILSIRDMEMILKEYFLTKQNIDWYEE